MTAPRSAFGASPPGGRPQRPGEAGSAAATWSDSGGAQGGQAAPNALPVTGRFAPSPTGPLHAGSAVAALASWLDARAQGGRWLVRIEDVDTPRCLSGMGEHILGQLAALGLVPDGPPLWQSSRSAAYQAALSQLLAAGLAYPCGCSRREIDAAWAALGRAHGRFDERIYPGTCRAGLQGRPARATRLRTVTDGCGVSVHWTDRRLGPQQQDVAQTVGDFILHRADGLWAYQLAVVVDDAAQGVTDVVRGADLCDNTARQIHLQRQLGLPLPRYLHTPLVLAPDGHKLSKQNGAAPLDASQPLATLQAAGAVLGLPVLPAAGVADWLAAATRAWAAAWPVQQQPHQPKDPPPHQPQDQAQPQPQQPQPQPRGSAMA